MALIIIPNPLSNGTTAFGSDVIANINAIASDYNGNITNANISNSAGITDNKLALITSVSKVSGSALTSLSSIPPAAGLIPSANIAGGTPYSTVLWYIDGSLATGDGQSATIRFPVAGTIYQAYAYVGTAPTGANVVIAIRKNNADIWSESPDHRLTITASTTSANTLVFDTTAVTAGDYFNLDVDQVGSSVIGSSLTVELTILRS